MLLSVAAWSNVVVTGIPRIGPTTPFSWPQQLSMGLLAHHSQITPPRLARKVKVRRKSIQICSTAKMAGGMMANSSGMRGANEDTSISQP